jgi:hypothetical protein
MGSGISRKATWYHGRILRIKIAQLLYAGSRTVTLAGTAPAPAVGPAAKQ